MAMQLENVLTFTARSKEMLELARRYATEAEKLPAGDAKRQWLEEEARRLMNDARALTEKAKEQVIRQK